MSANHHPQSGPWLNAPSGPQPLVHRFTVADVAQQVRAYRLPREMRRMAEAVHGWRAHYETFLQLAAQTRQEGWPFQVYPPGWAERASAAVGLFHKALDTSFDCHYPERATSNLRHLAGTIEQAAQRPQSLQGRQVGLVRRILADSEARWGPVGSPQRSVVLEQKRGATAAADFELSRETLLGRLAALDPKGGVGDSKALLAPTHQGIPIPSALAERVRRAQIATPDQLVQAGVIESLHGLAAISTQWTAAAVTDGRPEALRAMVSLAWTAFPHADPLSPTIQDWNRLLGMGGSDLRLDDSEANLDLARITLDVAKGTLYGRYYSLPSDVADQAQLDRLCRQRAGQRATDPPAGLLAEELRILTSHGLWPLWAEVRPDIEPMHCAHKTTTWVLAELGRPCPRKYQGWQRHKRVAHAFQRLVFYLSLAAPTDVEGFLASQRRQLRGPAGQCLARLLQGLVGTPQPAQVLVGWQHMKIGPKKA